MPQLNDLALEDLLAGFNDPAILVSPDHLILAANAAYTERFACAQTPIGQTCFSVSHRYDRPCDQMGEECPLHQAAESGRPHKLLHLHHTPKGRLHEQVSTYPVHNAQGELVCFVEVLTSVNLAGVEASGKVGLVGKSPAFNRMLGLIARVAPAMTPVLLLGESGTGKELAAQAIHRSSLRAEGPFVPVDCSGLSESLFESELFGHEKGAFTGAVGRKIGLVEAASGGTLFLDELGDIPLALQVKLLRLLESGTYRRVGGIEPQQADFRLVCATHRDLKAQIAEGTFRQDLYYRISAFPIPLPPLRERSEDLPGLSQTLLQRIEPSRQYSLAPATLERLRGYAFPGNIRELRNLLERAVLLADGTTLLPEHLPEEVGGSPPLPGLEGQGAAVLLPLEQVELRYLQWALSQHQGDKRSLAAALGVSERTLYRKLESLG